jgi:hypothetical protein
MNKIRIQDFNLTFSDLMQFPAWEYALDEEEIEGQDERTVKPYLALHPLDLSDAYFIVRASFILADGTSYKGYMKPQSVDRINVSDFMSVIIPYDLSPIIVLGKEHIHFQYGPKKPKAEEMQKVYDLFAKRPYDIFPINFFSDVEVSSSIHEGKLDGFMYFDQNIDDFAHTKSLKPSDIKYTK